MKREEVVHALRGRGHDLGCVAHMPAGVKLVDRILQPHAEPLLDLNSVPRQQVAEELAKRPHIVSTRHRPGAPGDQCLNHPIHVD
jgi:hypothetical protein